MIIDVVRSAGCCGVVVGVVFGFTNGRLQETLNKSMTVMTIANARWKFRRADGWEVGWDMGTCLSSLIQGYRRINPIGL